MVVRLGDIVARFGGELVGAADTAIARIAPLDSAQPGDISFLSNAKYRGLLRDTRASAVIVGAPSPDCPAAFVVVEQPYLYYAKVAQWLNPPPAIVPGIHPGAVVEGQVAPDACVAANAYVGKGAIIAAGAFIGPGSVVQAGASIGADTRLVANVTVGTDCVVGARCIIHPAVVIGADGFGFARERTGAWVKIPQIGRVRIGDDVEIGAGTTIDRGALTDTCIGDGVKLDNQIQIAHNVTIGEHSALAGCVGVAGSARIGRRVSVGGAAMILGHLSIADDVTVSTGTLVAKSITRAGTYSSAMPFMEHGQWLKNYSHLRHLDAMAQKIKALEQRIADLEKHDE